MKKLVRVSSAAVLTVGLAFVVSAAAGCGGSVDNTAEKPDQPVKSVPDDTWTVESGKTGSE